MTTAQRVSGFSLVELLVTLSIISLLVALLLPALHHARSSTRTGACASNIRQIALANHVYANEHRAQLCPGASDFVANLDRWFGSRESSSDPFEPTDGPLSDALGPGGAVRRCPSFEADYDHDDTAQAFESGCGGYGYNNAFLGVTADESSDRVGVRLSAIARPDRTIMFSDSAFAIATPGPGLIEYSFSEPPQMRGYPQYDLTPSMHFRHGDQANVAWADTSVRALAYGSTRENSIYGLSASQMAYYRIGWSGDDAASDLSNTLFDLE
ncbi:MAG: type II secretion system protein [Planctomycetes bacterium]|nr:type II secretion system protein [Planctomycetota bacterium]NOG53763.1 type II secretion system protein [Planctomycetota bacterium]